jgi:outer membrane biogenesis lipoprotein LolB
MNNVIRSRPLLLVTSILTACLSPAQRMQTRQSTRVQERTGNRMENHGL